MRILVTGTAGFIGFHVAKLLVEAGHAVCGVDGITAYYDVALKRARHAMLAQLANFSAHELLIDDVDRFARVYSEFAPEVVVHLAAQAGVRHSLDNPRVHVDANVIGTFNVLQLARLKPPAHLLIASTSSVYGANTKMPFVESDRTDHPLSFYAATKKAVEAMAHSYAYLWNIPTTVLRIFTAYGPWGRPDMALFRFTKSILEGAPIEIYNNGAMERDFTYIDDLAKAIVLLCSAVPTGATLRGPETDAGDSPAAPYRVVNIGSGAPINLLAFVSAVEAATGKVAVRRYLPMQPGDLPATFADTKLLERLTGFKPATPVATGVQNFVRWYREYYNV